MQTEQGVISDMTLTKLTPSSFVSDNGLNDNSCPWNPWLLSLSHLISLDSDSSISRTVLEPESLAVLPYPSTQTGLDFRQCGNGHTMQMDYASGQDTRGTTVPLDTRKWSPSPSFVAPYAPSGSHFALMDVRSHASLPCWNESLLFDGTPAPDIEGKLQVILHTQPVPDLGSGLSNLMTYHHENFVRPTFPQNNMLVSSSSDSTEDRASFFNDETQPPAVLYRPQEKGPGRQHCHRASAINIEGLWIDKDDLCSIVYQGSGMISVHECQWAKTCNPCGMWTVGSRARISAHIRKWHRHMHAASSRTRCLWDGCTARAMLKDSISRHVVTVHLGEGFHCQGCNEEFSRKDVYDQHVQKGELCRDASAVMVYGTERRVIDARKALQQGDAVRYAD